MANVAHHTESMPHAIADLERATPKQNPRAAPMIMGSIMEGLLQELNPGPLAPRIIPQDQAAGWTGYGP